MKRKDFTPKPFVLCALSRLCFTACLAALLTLGCLHTYASDYDSTHITATTVTDSLHQPCKPFDLIDIAFVILHKDPRVEAHKEKKAGVVYPSVLVGPSYNMQTGFQAVLDVDFAFYTGSAPSQNISTILSSITYTQKKQLAVPIHFNVWTTNNKYNCVVDWHYSIYPQFTYGLGGYTTLGNGYIINFNNLRLYHTFFKAIARDMLLGVGYNYDYYWKFREIDPPGTVTDLQKYGIAATERASGATLNFQYDTRRNSINPEAGGKYLDVMYRVNPQFAGSDNNWQTVAIDARDYIRLPASSRNILAFWSYDAFTFGGKAPYLLLPGTGGDQFNNTARGYVPGRFRGRDMLYLESEYRFTLTCNGLIGGVIFANAQSILEEAAHKFEVIRPAAGFGIRAMLNKFSRTNIAIDYAWGTGGSGGFYFNIGEVF